MLGMGKTKHFNKKENMKTWNDLTKQQHVCELEDALINGFCITKSIDSKTLTNTFMIVKVYNKSFDTLILSLRCPKSILNDEFIKNCIKDEISSMQ